MGKIMLNDMEFTTCHGVCPHEYEFDQKFKVDVWITTECVERAGSLDDLTLTINYASVFQLIEDVMYGDHVELIESLAFQIGSRVIENFKCVSNVKVRVRKMQPPISNFNGTAAIELEISRKDVE